jgi:hypothetical protein
MELKLTTNKQKILFWIILIFIPLVLFLLLESGLKILDYGDNLELFLQGKEQYSDYMYINRWVAKRYFRNRGIPDPSNDVFLKQKPENGYRIFVLGGSTAAGWPYTNNIMFSRILQKRLAGCFRSRFNSNGWKYPLDQKDVSSSGSFKIISTDSEFCSISVISF